MFTKWEFILILKELFLLISHSVSKWLASLNVAYVKSIRMWNASSVFTKSVFVWLIKVLRGSCRKRNGKQTDFLNQPFLSWIQSTRLRSQWVAKHQKQIQGWIWNVMNSRLSFIFINNKKRSQKKVNKSCSLLQCEGRWTLETKRASSGAKSNSM